MADFAAITAGLWECWLIYKDRLRFLYSLVAALFRSAGSNLLIS